MRYHPHGKPNKRQIIKGVLIFILLGLSLSLGFLTYNRIMRSNLASPTDNSFITHRVAHAGGGINGHIYTNSFEALNKNYLQGFTYFELDFVFTADNHLICLHDWQSNFESMFGFPTDERLTLSEFKQLVDTETHYHPCTLYELAEWLESNPRARIVTDIKERNLEGLHKMTKTITDYQTRIIPQVYQPENFEVIRDMGFQDMIWTLYMYLGSDKEVLKQVRYFDGNFAITMPHDRARSDLPGQLRSKGIPTYAHTINDTLDKLELFRDFAVTEIYTDFLPPTDNNLTNQ